MNNSEQDHVLQAKQQVIRAGLELVKSGLIARTWGNISARISDTQFVITPSGRAYDTLKPDDIVAVNIADCSYEGKIKPSSEKGVHAAAYRQRPDVNFVIHTHQNYATDISTLGKTLVIADVGKLSASADPEKAKNTADEKIMSEPGNIRQEDLEQIERILGPSVPTAGYGLNATKQLTDFVEQAIAENPESHAVLMRNHGTLCLGKNYDDAFLIAHTLEKVCKEKFLQLTHMIAPEDMEPGYRLSKYCTAVMRNDIENDPADEKKPVDRSGNDTEHLKMGAGSHGKLFAAQSGIGCIIETNAPYIHEFSTYGTKLVPYVDDMAQIVGMDIPMLPEDASENQIAAELKRLGANDGEVNHIVMIQNRGAVCTAASEEDTEAVVMILDKDCQMGLLEKAGAEPIPVSKEDGEAEHRAYVESYSKLNQTNR